MCPGEAIMFFYFAEIPEDPSSMELSKTMDPEKQKENVADLRAFGVQEVNTFCYSLL